MLAVAHQPGPAEPAVALNDRNLSELARSVTADGSMLIAMFRADTQTREKQLQTMMALHREKEALSARYKESDALASEQSKELR